MGCRASTWPHVRRRASSKKRACCLLEFHLDFLPERAGSSWLVVWKRPHRIRAPIYQPSTTNHAANVLQTPKTFGVSHRNYVPFLATATALSGRCGRVQPPVKRMLARKKRNKAACQSSSGGSSSPGTSPKLMLSRQSAFLLPSSFPTLPRS